MIFSAFALLQLSLLPATGWVPRFALRSTVEPQTYDYVVIGGGNAGLAVASRLTEDAHVTVVVLEAGSNVEDLPEVFIPGLVGTGQAFTTLNWAYETVPQEHLNGRTTIINAGKALGGGTIINSMIFPRAEKEQYDAWGTLNNNDPTWTWDALLPAFKKLEIFTPPTPSQIASGVRFDASVHGEDAAVGRVKVGYPNFFYEQSAMWEAASRFRPSPDLSNGRPQGTAGIAPNSLDARNNTRCSSVCAYYTPFAARPNLAVRTEVFATRILWKPAAAHAPLRATGVEYRAADGSLHVVHARKEVVVAAGTIATPKVLEHSGVGNATILSKAGVTPVLDMPTVGENLADHVHGWANAFTNASVTRDMLNLDPDFKDRQLALWHHNRTGVLSAAPRSLGLAAASDLFSAAQIERMMADTEKTAAHYARLFSNGNAALAKGIEAQYTSALKLWQRAKLAPVELNIEPGYAGPTALADRPARNYTSINAVLFAPFSRGRTHIVSADPRAKSAIDPAYYAHPLDAAMHAAGIQRGREMLRAPPLDTIFVGEFQPGAAHAGAEAEAGENAVEEWARASAASDNHVVGTMAMMPRELGGVVDTRLRIYGIENVRVVDASIIPMPISAHICSTVYMIAERAADLIREDAVNF